MTTAITTTAAIPTTRAQMHVPPFHASLLTTYHLFPDCCQLSNQNNCELYGRVLKVNLAKPMATKEGAGNRAVWNDENWLRENDSQAHEPEKHTDRTVEG